VVADRAEIACEATEIDLDAGRWTTMLSLIRVVAHSGRSSGDTLARDAGTTSPARRWQAAIIRARGSGCGHLRAGNRPESCDFHGDSCKKRVTAR
jgi:hypothetical protein